MPSKYTKSTKPRSSPIGRKLPPTGTDRDLNLASMSRLFSDEDAAREFLEAKYWPDGPVCPHCGEHGGYKLTAGKKTEGKRQMRKGVYKCKAPKCRKQFTVRMGRIFEESKLPLRKWLMAIHLLTSSKKGFSSNQLARELDCTVTTAWFLSHRIRECMKLNPISGMLSGVVEADETYVGGKPRNRTPNNRATGRGTKKAPVLVMVQRDGEAVCRPLPTITANELRENLGSNVSPDSTLVTDEYRAYNRLGREFAEHHQIHHGKRRYARMEGELNVNTNTAESFFALLKRGHYGVFHQLSKHHLHRYCTEFEFRWNARKISDGERMVLAIDGAEGKRLKYRDPVKAISQSVTSDL